MKKSILFILFALVSVVGFSQITGWNAKVGMKGAKQDELTINAYYLELPVMAAARFDVANNTNVVINAGPYLACGIAGKSKVDMGNVEYKENTFGDGGLKRFDAGLGVGVALELGQIIVGLDGQFGLVDVQKVGNPKNMNFSIVLGYKF